MRRVLMLAAVAACALGAARGGEEDLAPAPRTFDSDLALGVSDAAYHRIGITPTTDWRGVQTPAEGVWYVAPRPEGIAVLAAKLAREMAAARVPGLDLSDFGEMDFAWLDAFANVPTLRALRLNNVSETMLAQACKLTQLSVLRFHSEVMSDQALAPLANLKKLTSLHIFAPIGDAALEQLAGLEHLEELYLDSRRITDAGLAKLAGLKHLKRLTVTSSFSAKGLAALKDLDLNFLRFDEYTCEILGQQLAIASPVFSRNPVLVPYPGNALSEDERARLDKSVLALKSERYDEREAASKALTAFGSSCAAYLSKRAKELKHGADPDPEQVMRLCRIADQLMRQAATDWEIEAAKGLSPDARIKAKMLRRISFEFVDKSAPECCEVVSKHCGVPWELKGNAGNPISLRVAEMSADTALEWVSKLMDFTCEVQDGKLVIEPNMHRTTFTDVPLPVAAGEAPWTMDEKIHLRNALNGLPVFNYNAPETITRALEVDDRPTEGGLAVNFPDALRAALARFNPTPGQRAPGSPTPSLQVLLDALDAPVAEAFEFKDTPLDEAVRAISAQAKVNIRVHPVLLSSDIPKITGRFEKGRYRDALVWLCKQVPCACIEAVDQTHGGHALALAPLRPLRLAQSICVIDLRPALAAGVPRADLEAGLIALLKEARLDPTSDAFVRDRWIGAMDPWTERRAFAWIKACAEVKKAAPLPPAPWFFETLKEPEGEPAAPAAAPEPKE